MILKLKSKSVLLILLILLLAGPSQSVGIANPDDAATVTINPVTASVSGCGIVDVYINVNNVTDLYALDVQLTFNPAVLEVVDANPATTTVEIEPFIDPAFNFNAGFVIRNTADNFTGTIWYAATQLNPALPRSGSGHVARIRFRGRVVGAGAITITSVQLSNRNGDTLAIGGMTGGSVTVGSPAAPTLGISRLNATQVRLSWPSATGVSQYYLYRSTTPYFYTPETATGDYATLTPPTLTYDDTVLGNTTTNYFYSLRAVCSAGGISAASTEAGKFEYPLQETSTTDYAWVALPLSAPGMMQASDLAASIEANSNRSVTVLTVNQWKSTSQSIETYIRSINFGNFTISTRMPYRVEIDIPGASSGTVIWALVGSVPPISRNVYTLRQTAGSDFTWVMQPLELSSITTSRDLALNIESNSSAAVTVLSMARLNTSSQSVEAYIHSINIGSFTTRFGYPYRVEISAASGSVSWP